VVVSGVRGPAGWLNSRAISKGSVTEYDSPPWMAARQCRRGSRGNPS
jgi:hypothetical protein